MNILIDGGTGFVGYWMLNTAPQGFEVCCVDKSLYGVEWEQFTYDAIVHLAPISPDRVLAYAQKHDARVLFASSGAVYEGTTEYADNKRKWEQECMDSGADVVIARLFTFIGAHLKRHTAYEFIAAAKAGKPLEVWGDGSTVRSYLYGEDLGRWMWKLLLDGEGVYNVGSEIPITIQGLAEMISEMYRVPIIHLDKLDHKETHYLPATDKAQELGCVEMVGLREAIERTIND